MANFQTPRRIVGEASPRWLHGAPACLCARGCVCGQRCFSFGLCRGDTRYKEFIAARSRSAARLPGSTRPAASLPASTNATRRACSVFIPGQAQGFANCEAFAPAVYRVLFKVRPRGAVLADTNPQAHYFRIPHDAPGRLFKVDHRVVQALVVPRGRLFSRGFVVRGVHRTTAR